MRPVIVTRAAAGQSSTIPVNWNANPCSYTFQTAVTGTVTYSIEWTLEDPFGASAPTTWTAFTGAAAQSGSVGLNFDNFPVRGVRINVTVGATGSDTVTLTFLQSGGITGV